MKARPSFLITFVVVLLLAACATSGEREIKDIEPIFTFEPKLSLYDRFLYNTESGKLHRMYYGFDEREDVHWFWEERAGRLGGLWCGHSKTSMSFMGCRGRNLFIPDDGSLPNGPLVAGANWFRTVKYEGGRGQKLHTYHVRCLASEEIEQVPLLGTILVSCVRTRVYEDGTLGAQLRTESRYTIANRQLVDRTIDSGEKVSTISRIHQDEMPTLAHK